MSKWDELKRLAESAKKEGDWYNTKTVDVFPEFEVDQEFMLAASPDFVLSLIAENERLTQDIRMLVRQHMPLDALEGMPGWSEVVEARKAVEQRDQLRSLLERAYGAVAVDQNHALLAEIDAVLRKDQDNG